MSLDDMCNMWGIFDRLSLLAAWDPKQDPFPRSLKYKTTLYFSILL
jgi:hypothetical protein